ncbi:MAG: class I SAM-dependent methyltransferase [Anaerolineae bacterium]|nr:class I SAM-dependent methyltransferase [Anaerolineae bacterium]
MTVQESYDAWAASYDHDRNLTRDLDARVTRDVLGGHHYPAMLELGCGTGKNTGFYAGIAGRVLALDFSAAMLAQAVRKQARPQAAAVAFARADLASPWPCAPQSVHLVACNLVLEHLADLHAVFAQARQVLAPGGQCFICELHPCRQYQGKKAAFQHNDTAVEIPAFVHHTSDFLQAARAAGLTVQALGEWWHAEDSRQGPPRLISFLFEHATHPAR